MLLLLNGDTLVHQHPITYVSGLFQWSQLNWASLTKEAYVIYVAVKKLSFYLADATNTLLSDHLPITWFLQKATPNAKVNNWGIELSYYNIKFNLN